MLSLFIYILYLHCYWFCVLLRKLCFLCVRLWVLLTSVWAGSLLLLRYLMFLDLFIYFLNVVESKNLVE